MPTDPNYERRIALVQSLHQSPVKLVLALSGGGSLTLGDLLSVPGGSQTVLEASVPYSQESLQEYIGRIPDQYCSQRTARHLAMTAFNRGRSFLGAQKSSQKMSRARHGVSRKEIADISHEDAFPEIEAGSNGPGKSETVPIQVDLDDFIHLIGIGCTASLVTNRKKEGDYRVHVAAQTLRRTVVFSLNLTKDSRTRREEERLLADLILDVIETVHREMFPLKIDIEKERTDASPDRPVKELKELSWNTFCQGTTDTFPIHEALPLPLKEGETIEGKQAVGSPSLVDLFFGKTWAVLWRAGEIRHFRFRNDLPITQSTVYNPQAEDMQAIFPGSFNPIHRGHLEMIDIAEHRLGNRVALEISVQNVDKPSLDYLELEDRLSKIAQARPDLTVWLSQTPLFEEKSELFQGTTFVVGADTLRRFAELRFYHESIHQLHDVLRVIAYHNCRFLVFAREGADGIESLQTLDLPDMLRSLADEVPGSEFAMNISSRVMRQNEV